MDRESSSSTPTGPARSLASPGVLALHGLDVLGARAHSDEQGMAASLFRTADATAPDASRLDGGRQPTSAGRLAGELALSARLAERARTYRAGVAGGGQPVLSPSVDLRRRRQQQRDRDRGARPRPIGVLHRITKALAELGLDIRHATVQTLGPRSSTRSTCARRTVRKVTDQYHRAEIERAVLHAVGSPS